MLSSILLFVHICALFFYAYGRQGLITGARGQFRVKGNRVAFPGDYVVHEDYGIGKFLGISNVDITPARSTRKWLPVVLVKYNDSLLSAYQKVAEKQFWFYRSSSVMAYDLSPLLDTRKWRRRKANVEESSKSQALNLARMMAIRNSYHRIPYLQNCPLYDEFESRFPYTPTPDQIACFNAIENDMANNTRPMDRLICGDVGFGKTEVAIRAIYRAVLSNRQAALLAPTRILAMQHARVLRKRMPEVNIQLLRGGGTSSSSREIKDSLVDGTCQVVIGTHALLSPNISFNNLGLLIIDEEQRFGVHHKEKLKALTTGTDVLTLSATPIPRTLQMSLSGMRDMSLLNSPPPGRKEVITKAGVLSDTDILGAIEREIARGGQVFVVCPFITQVNEEFERLERILPSHITMSKAHSQMDNLEEVIDDFLAGAYKLLIATTVIENGIDIPNVNTIIVHDAGRFGIGQLYQLRGRVGRSDKQAFAYFNPANGSLTIDAEQRLEYLQAFTALGSGYDLSRRDMEMRGHGTIFGTEQSGAKDVGLDLQAEILAAAVENIRHELIIAAPDTRIALGTKLEMLGVMKVGPMPEADDPMGVSRWEGEVSRVILSSWKSQDANRLVQAFLSAASAAELKLLNEEWRKMYSGPDGVLPGIVQELFARSAAKSSCRRIGITEVKLATLPSDALEGANRCYIECKMPNVTLALWRKFLEGAVPVALKGLVRFDERTDECGFLLIEGQNIQQVGLQDLLKLVLPLSAVMERRWNDKIGTLSTAKKASSSPSSENEVKD